MQCPLACCCCSGRQMNHPDLINLQQLDGVAFRLKYLVLVRNATVISTYYYESLAFYLTVTLPPDRFLL